MTTFALSKEQLEAFSKLSRSQVLDMLLPDKDVMKIRGSTVPLMEIEEDPDTPCEHCSTCSIFLQGGCDSVRQEFCEIFDE